MSVEQSSYILGMVLSCGRNHPSRLGMYVRNRDAGALTACVEVWTPAKLNLTLDILNRRSDGFHEIETVMTAISIFDTLQVSANDTGNLQLQLADAGGCVDEESIPVDDTNLVMRALNLLRESTGCDCGASVVLHKRIPSAAGMGGGSSDAAAALVAGNRLWRLNQRRETLCEMAASLGSDVPFFLGASPATCRGRGEKIVPARNLGRLEFVIVRPPVGLSTAKVYAACTPRRPETMSSFESAVAPVPCAGQVARWMRNGLQDAAELLTPWIGRLRGVFDRLGVHSHQLTGSGSAYFGICRSAGQSVKIAKQLRAMGLGRVLRASSARGLL